MSSNSVWFFDLISVSLSDLKFPVTLHVVTTRAIHDVKATDMGLSMVRFKAEVDFDGRVVTRSYLEKQDIDQILNVSQINKDF